ncbi:MAG: ATP-binding cassette domain-containing protein [Clostridia bacterium]|nr:ATP-binding cassette domain-containing protein [Clostridia bacterium]MDY3785346.1 ATP-binding cassette domain-containing protein [Eubacteriales bacterium]
MNQYNFANDLGFSSEIKSEKTEISPLNINNLTLIKNFPAKNINPQFSLDIGRGEVFCLICPDINEKNALSDTLSGVLPPENGSIEINGYDLYSDRASALSYMGVARPDMKFYPELTAYENLLLVAKLKKCKSLICRDTSDSDTSDSASTVSPEAAAEQAARLAGFEKILRGGSLFCVRTGKFGETERARLMIAAAIVGRPELLIIDSPWLLTESSEDAKKLSLLIKYMSSLGTAVLVIDSCSDGLAELLSRDTKFGIVSRGSLAALGTADEISAGSITDSTEYEIILACKPDDDTMKSAEAVLLSLGHRSFSMDDSGRLLINIPNRDREKTVAWLIRMLVERNINICSVTPLYKSGLDIVIGEFCGNIGAVGKNADANVKLLAKTIPGIKNVKGDSRNDE